MLADQSFPILIAVIVLGFLVVKLIRKQDNEQRAVAASRANTARINQLVEQKAAIMRRTHPLWPPRKPDDWGQEAENAHRIAMHAYQAHVASFARSGLSYGLPPPLPPMQQSWEESNRRLQADVALQTRWAQNDQGQWVSVQWGNPSLLEAGKAPEIRQVMRDKETNEWKWILIGRGSVSLDWQRGRQGLRNHVVKWSDGTQSVMLRPVGAVGSQDAPPPLRGNDERGSSEWKTADDLAGLGAVRRK